jgi:hypothetical protein
MALVRHRPTDSVRVLGLLGETQPCHASGGEAGEHESALHGNGEGSELQNLAHGKMQRDMREWC